MDRQDDHQTRRRYALGSVTATRVVNIASFPAVQTATAYGNPAHECLVFVDVAQGQSLQVEYLNQRGDHPGISHEIACQLATTAATEMITTLRSGAWPCTSRRGDHPRPKRPLASSAVRGLSTPPRRFESASTRV